jgi:hypothetical protein
MEVCAQRDCPGVATHDRHDVSLPALAVIGDTEGSHLMVKRITVDVTNLRQVFDALDEWDKKAGNRLRKMIRDAGGDVVTSASYLAPGRPPLSGWGNWTSSKDGRDLGFNPSTVARGFKVRQNNFKRRGISAGIAFEVYQSNAGGSIYEVIGKGNRVGESNFNWQGAGFVDRVRARFPQREPRSLFAAYYDVMTPALQDKIRDSIIAEARKAGLD